MKIPFHRPNVPESLDSIYKKSIKEGWLTTGGIVQKFEEKLKGYFNANHVILLNSCTAALHLSLLGKGFSKKDKFLLPTLTFASTVECGEYLGMEPMLIDCAPNSFLLDLNKVEDALKKDSLIKVLIPMHYGGEAVNMEEVYLLANKYNIFVLEDAAHALETKYNNHKIGNTNHAAAFSFYANKNLTTGGEGGAVATNNDHLAKQIKKLSLHGITKDGWSRFKSSGKWEYDITELGYKYNLTDLSASFGLWQFNYIDEWHKKRIEIAQNYLLKLKKNKGLILPDVADGHAWHLFVIKIVPEHWNISRNQIIQELNELGIGLAVHYKPIHKLSYYKKNYGLNEKYYPNANKLFDTIISLPIYPLISENDINYITDAINHMFQKYSK